MKTVSLISAFTGIFSFASIAYAQGAAPRASLLPKNRLSKR